MNATTPRQARIARLRELKETMTLAQIAEQEGCTRQNIAKLIGPTRTTPNPILLEVHKFLVEYDQEFHTAPSLPEIAARFPSQTGRARSTSVVNYWLDQMERLNMIHPRLRGTARSARAKSLPRSNIIQQMQSKLEKEISHA